MKNRKSQSEENREEAAPSEYAENRIQETSGKVVTVAGRLAGGGVKKIAQKGKVLRQQSKAKAETRSLDEAERISEEKETPNQPKAKANTKKAKSEESPKQAPERKKQDISEYRTDIEKRRQPSFELSRQTSEENIQASSSEQLGQKT